MDPTPRSPGPARARGVRRPGDATVSRFVEPGLEGPLRALEEALRRQAFGTPPPGYAALAPARAMRAVLGGTWTGPRGPLPVVVKWHRPVTWSDRVARAVRGGRGPREGRLLLRLTAAGLPVPRALAFADEGPDLLVTQRLPEVRALPPAILAPAPLVREVAGLLARLFQAGLVHRDLTAANLALVDGHPVLIDLGGARLGGRRHARRVAHLAQAAHGLLFGATRATQARALKAWLDALGEPADAWAHLAFEVERALARRRRRHHRRRERTLEEPGRRFARFEGEGTSGVRRDPEAPPAWEAVCGAWIDAAPAGARAFPGSTRVALAHLPGRTEPVVLKRFEPVRAGRRSRALTAFLRAAGLAERGLPSPRPLLAAARHGGGSVLVSEAIAAPSLWEVVRPGGALARWSPSRRRAFLTALGRALRRLHDADVSHRDLFPSPARTAPGKARVAIPELQRPLDSLLI